MALGLQSEAQGYCGFHFRRVQGPGFGDIGLTIDGATPEWFGPLAAQHQIVLYELVHDRGTLEEVFLRITHGFAAPDPGAPGPTPGVLS